MANGDLTILKRTMMSLKAAKGCWSIGVDYQPGVVVVALATRKTPADQINGADAPIPVGEIDALIERLQRAKANALRKSQ